MSDSNKASATPDAPTHDETTSTAPDDPAASTEQSTSPLTHAPKRIAIAQTVCNERNAKGKPCHGFLKQMHTGGQSSQEHLLVSPFEILRQHLLALKLNLTHYWFTGM